MTPQPRVEARLLTACLTEPGILELCADLELGDLTDYRHRAILTAIREIQETGDQIDMHGILEAIAMRDMQRETVVSELVDCVFLAEMLCAGEHRENDAGRVWVYENPPYGQHAAELVPFDLAQLRRIARSNA